MKKTSIFAAVAAAVALTAGSAFAADMEKCHVVGKDGKGLIKEGKGSCATKGHSCSGHNKSGDPEAWIMVPKGQCKKINMGNFSGISKDIKDKISIQKMHRPLPTKSAPAAQHHS